MMKVHGSCYCKKVTYEATVDPSAVVVCHCVDCQMLTGSAYRVTVFTTPENFKHLSGTPKSFVKIAENGNKRLHVFCGDCGSPLWATNAEPPASAYGLRVGTLAERAKLAPTREIWCQSALPWAQKLETSTRLAKQS